MLLWDWTVAFAQTDVDEGGARVGWGEPTRSSAKFNGGEEGESRSLAWTFVAGRLRRSMAEFGVPAD